MARADPHCPAPLSVTTLCVPSCLLVGLGDGCVGLVASCRARIFRLEKYPGGSPQKPFQSSSPDKRCGPTDLSICLQDLLGYLDEAVRADLLPDQLSGEQSL